MARSQIIGYGFGILGALAVGLAAQLALMLACGLISRRLGGSLRLGALVFCTVQSIGIGYFVLSRTVRRWREERAAKVRQ